MAPASLRALLSGLIDYAGLFPPAGLPLADVARNYGTYRQSDERWALGRLVVPATRLDELLPLVRSFGDRWRVTALVGDDLAGDARRIADIGDSQTVVVESAEVRGTTTEQIHAAMEALGSVPEVYVEVPLTTNLPLLLCAVADAGARAKVRTGALTDDAIPSAADCARFLAGCASRKVAFKATAGLHHPLRGRYPLTYAPDAPHGELFGFLNVFIAAAFAAGGMPEHELAQVLSEADVRRFDVRDSGLSWRDHSLSLDDLCATRASFAIAFGSCSFREPIDELTQLGLLP